MGEQLDRATAHSSPTPLIQDRELGTGTVTLVGAGPGDPALMTVAARDALASSTIVFYDRLGPTDDLASWAPQAELIDVGKLPGFHRVPQEEINRRLVLAAQQGHRVLRLKGGDPYVFGRGYEELVACRTANVPVQVIPGITSAIAVPGAAGIPVTFRELSQSFTVVTGHDPFSDEFCAALVTLVRSGGTVVILMGMQRLSGHLLQLRQHGLTAATPAAVIMNGCTAHQRLVTAEVAQLPHAVAEHGLSSPAVIVIGDVVSLAL